MLKGRSSGVVRAVAVVALMLASSSACGDGDPLQASGSLAPLPSQLIAGRFEAPGIDLARLVVRITPLGPESLGPFHTDLDEQGRFALTALGEFDHRVEVVVRSNPALVLARAEPVRPGSAPLTLRSDLKAFFGPGPVLDEPR